jgi:DNA-binding ferritin-like protein (Dps family)
LSISEQLEREKKIKQEINRIKKLYKDFPKEKAKVLEGLINEAAFMKLTLQETREDIIKNGTIELFEQGEQCFNRERPEVKIYTTFMQRYSNVMKQLIDLLPVEIKKEEADALMEFVRKGKISK